MALRFLSMWKELEVKNIQMENNNMFGSFFKLIHKDEMNQDQFLTLDCCLIVVNVVLLLYTFEVY